MGPLPKYLLDSKNRIYAGRGINNSDAERDINNSDYISNKIILMPNEA